MQPRLAPPRGALTSAFVTRLIRDVPGLLVGSGCELVDRALNVIDDITDDFGGGSVSRGNYDTLHGKASLNFGTSLPWGSAIVRPYMILSDGLNTARFNLGAYFTATPSRPTGFTPATYTVECSDMLLALNSPVGESYSVAAGDTYINAIRTILDNQGYSDAYIIDQSRAATTLTKAKSWPIDQNTTWLIIVNKLCSGIGYRGAYSDWDGRVRIESYALPADRASEWTYAVDPLPQSMLEPNAMITHDYFNTPNRWVGVRTNNVQDVAPVEGNGIFVYVNTNNGETSVEARGRTITKIVSVEAADQDALATQVMATVATDMAVGTTIDVETSPNPLHWHFDRLTLDNPDISAPVQVIEQSWSLPLDGGDMQHTWKVI